MSNSENSDFYEANRHIAPATPQRSDIESVVPPSPFNALPRESLPWGETLPIALPVPEPHPGFWWSLLWCVGYLVVTQGIPVVFFFFLLIGLLVIDPAAAE